MLFKRRNRQSFFFHFRNFLWPKAGWKRAFNYIRYRFVRLPGTPYSISAGFACGVAVSFTPLLGFHFVGAALFAWLIRGNLVASALGTAVGNPWTFPFIWLWILNLGRWILGETSDLSPNIEITNTSIVNNIADIMIPMLVGSLIMAPLSWLMAYYPMKYIIVSYRAARKLQITRKMKKNLNNDSKK